MPSEPTPLFLLHRSMNNAFEEVFLALREVLWRCTPELQVTRDDPGIFTLTARPIPGGSDREGFGSVQVKKNCVSLHLMPVYLFADLLDQTSTALRKRMQGKSCFNFRRVEEELVQELTALTGWGVERVRREGRIPSPTLCRRGPAPTVFPSDRWPFMTIKARHISGRGGETVDTGGLKSPGLRPM